MQRFSAKGTVEQVRPKPAVNAALWAREAVANLECQEVVDTKAFTGRGNLYALRQLVASLEDVEARMRALSKSSKALVDTSVYLTVHRRSSSGYTFLRWRERAGANRHLSWNEVSAKIAIHPSAQQRWCVEASDLANALNSEHLALRETIKSIRGRVAQSASHLYARSLPRGYG